MLRDIKEDSVLTVCLDPGLVDVPEVEVTAERTAKCLIAGVVTGLIVVYICCNDAL